MSQHSIPSGAAMWGLQPHNQTCSPPFKVEQIQVGWAISSLANAPSFSPLNSCHWHSDTFPGPVANTWADTKLLWLYRDQRSWAALEHQNTGSTETLKLFHINISRAPHTRTNAAFKSRKTAPCFWSNALKLMHSIIFGKRDTVTFQKVGKKSLI